MLKYFIEGSVLGLTAGISCAFFCLPVLIGLGTRDVNNITAVINISFLILGRLIAYLFVGFFFSLVGISISAFAGYEFIFNIIIGALLVFWGIKGFTESDKENSCPAKKMKKTFPFLTGILTGLSPCPPFIAGITRVIAIGSIPGGISYFTGFFLLTTVFLLPGLFTGLIKYKRELKVVSSLVAMIFGIVFLAGGLVSGGIFYAH
jgi:sulfite exporter TauE/SafE